MISLSLAAIRFRDQVGGEGGQWFRQQLVGAQPEAQTIRWIPTCLRTPIPSARVENARPCRVDPGLLARR